MAKIERFEDLEVWKGAMSFCEDTYKLTNEKKFSIDFALKDQIRRSAISVPSNISEGFERDAKNQFIYFLVIAKGSCGELRTQLRIAFSLGYLSTEKYDELVKNCISVSKQLKGFINYIKTHQQKK